MPPRGIQEPYPGRNYYTKLVDEEVLQNFPANSFVMRNAVGRFVEYDGATDVNTADVRYAPEPPHNYGTFRQGGSKLEVLLKRGEGEAEPEIEITAYNGGAAITAAQLQVGKEYGITRIAAGAANNPTGRTQWVLDLTKTTAAQAVLRIKEIDLRGFLATGKVADWHTGGVGDNFARVLVTIVK